MKKTYGEFIAEMHTIPTSGYQAHHALGGLMSILAGVAADLPAKKQKEILESIAGVAERAALVKE